MKVSQEELEKFDYVSNIDPMGFTIVKKDKNSSYQYVDKDDNISEEFLIATAYDKSGFARVIKDKACNKR